MKPKPINPKQVAQLAGYGLTQEQIADFFGLSDQRLRARFLQDDTLASAYKTGRAQAISQVSKTVFKQAMAGQVACAFFYLKTQAGWRETERHEITSKDGEPIEIRDAQQTLRRRIGRLADRLTAGSELTAARPDGNGRRASPR